MNWIVPWLHESTTSGPNEGARLRRRDRRDRQTILILRAGSGGKERGGPEQRVDSGGSGDKQHASWIDSLMATKTTLVLCLIGAAGSLAIGFGGLGWSMMSVEDALIFRWVIGPYAVLASLTVWRRWNPGEVKPGYTRPSRPTFPPRTLRFECCDHESEGDRIRVACGRTAVCYDAGARR